MEKIDLTHWDNEEVKIVISRHDLRQVVKVIMDECAIIALMAGKERQVESLKNFIDEVKRKMVEIK